MNYDTLCFSGGGIKGIIFVGILKHLKDINFIDMDNITTFIGTSIGSIISFILSPLLTSITYTGIFTDIPDAYSESKLFIYNNIFIKHLFEILIIYFIS
jgi:patatin-like phospholipase/acyl hydrolase